MADGNQQSGLYRSRYGSIVLQAKVQGGQPTDYFMELNGKTPEPSPPLFPKSADGCLKSKSVKLPVAKAQGACVGTRFRVVLDRSTSAAAGAAVRLAGRRLEALLDRQSLIPLFFEGPSSRPGEGPFSFWSLS